MGNNRHDVPSDFIVQSGRVYRSSEKPRASLAALQWASDRADMSYGSFILGLKPEDEVRIQQEFDDMLRQRKVEAAKRHKARMKGEPI